MGTLAAFTWMLFIPIAILNGLLRETIYKPLIGDLAAHQLSTVFAAMALITLAYFMLKDEVDEADNGTLFTVGFIWVLMTVCFEFGFGHYVDGAPWNKLLEDYNILSGRVWSLFLGVLFITPYLVKVLHGRRT